jgi:A/G-specific adenine glycosylase
MLQQTQVARIGEAWARFLDRFPTIEALASADLADVLRAWAGLGYNRRAVSLHRLARVVVAEHGGELPRSVEELERLPGVGPYTARAVAAIAFGQPAAAVDTNVRRVLARLFGGGRAPARREIQSLADALLPADRPGDWTHALMDLGATVCRSSTPSCEACPLLGFCAWAASPPSTRIQRAGAKPASSFEASSRWLRGRIVGRLRDTPGRSWVAFNSPLGVHDAPAIATALRALERDGLVERHPSDPRVARFPTSDGGRPLAARPRSRTRAVALG